LGVAEGFSGLGVPSVFSGFGVVSGGFPGFSPWAGFSFTLGVGLGLGVDIALGVGVGFGVGVDLGVGLGLGVGVALAGEGVVAARSDSGTGVPEGLCVPRRGVGVDSGAGAGVAAGLCFFEPNSHWKNERFFGFGVGSGADSELTTGDGVAAASPGFVEGLLDGFSSLAGSAGLFSSGFLSPALMEELGVLCASDASWA
jgi:hypothetical protein